MLTFYFDGRYLKELSFTLCLLSCSKWKPVYFCIIFSGMFMTELTFLSKRKTDVGRSSRSVSLVYKIFFQINLFIDSLYSLINTLRFLTLMWTHASHQQHNLSIFFSFPWKHFLNPIFKIMQNCVPFRP